MNVFIGLFIAIALLLMLVILIQKGKGGGVGSMFGGLGASSLLGSKTGDFLTWVTIGLVSFFLVLAVLMDKYLKTQVTGSDLMTPPAQSAPADLPAEGQEAPALPEAPGQPAAPEEAAPAQPAAEQPAEQPTP